MALSEMWDAPDIVPTITFTDLDRLEWLERVFGFRERKEARLNWPGTGMTWFEVGNSLLSIATPDETLRQKPETPGLKYESLRRRHRRTFRACEGRRRKNSFGARRWILGRSNLPRVGSRRTSLGDFAKRSRPRSGSLATPPGVIRGVVK